MVHAALVFLLCSALAPELSISPGVFPDGSEVWDRVGLFVLQDGAAPRRVLLYYHDTDSVMEKEMAKKGSAMGVYPNCFTLHAICETASGRWVLAKPHYLGRVRLKKATALDGGVEIELRGNFRIDIPLGEVRGEGLARAVKLNRLVTKRVSFEDGVLTVK